MWLFMFSSSFSADIEGLMMTILVSYTTYTQSSSFIISSVINTENDGEYSPCDNGREKKEKKPERDMYVSKIGWLSSRMSRENGYTESKKSFFSLSGDIASILSPRRDKHNSSLPFKYTAGINHLDVYNYYSNGRLIQI